MRKGKRVSDSCRKWTRSHLVDVAVAVATEKIRTLFMLEMKRTKLNWTFIKRFIDSLLLNSPHTPPCRPATTCSLTVWLPFCWSRDGTDSHITRRGGPQPVTLLTTWANYTGIGAQYCKLLHVYIPVNCKKWWWRWLRTTGGKHHCTNNAGN